MFNSRIPVCCFLSLLSPLFLIRPLRCKRSRQASPRMEIKEMGCLHRISFIGFSSWWKGLFITLFWYGSPFGLMASIAPCFLGNLYSLVSWSLSEEATLYCGIYIILTEFNKAPLFHQSLGPCVFLSLSLSLSISGWFPGAWKPAA